MVDARPYPRENIGNRAYAACKYVLRVVAARSYPRENIGDRAYLLENTFCEWYKRVPTPVKTSGTVHMRLVNEFCK